MKCEKNMSTMTTDEIHIFIKANAINDADSDAAS